TRRRRCRGAFASARLERELGVRAPRARRGRVEARAGEARAAALEARALADAAVVVVELAELELAVHRVRVEIHVDRAVLVLEGDAERPPDGLLVVAAIHRAKDLHTLAIHDRVSCGWCAGAEQPPCPLATVERP